MSFGKTLKEIRKKNKDSLRSLAEKMGVHFTFIDKIEKEISPVSKTFLEKIVSTYPEDKIKLKKEYLNDILPKILKNEEPIKQLEDNILTLPVYGKVSAGRGQSLVDVGEVLYYMPILKGTFSKKSYFVEINGDSMYPTLEDGQLALVDPTNIDYVKNKIYVVSYNDEGFIKRLEKKDKLKIVTLKSDNPDYDDIDIPEDMQEFFSVNGRVVEVISRKKF